MISCVLLSAGNSNRFGSPKALAKLDDKITVVEFMQAKLLQTKIDEIVVVLGAYAAVIEPYILKHERIKSVYNKDYNLGQTSSFKTGLKEINPASSGVFLLPIDCPFIQTRTIDQLIEKLLDGTAGILVPSFQNRKGHPPLFHAKMKDLILKISDSQGLNDFEHKHTEQISIISVNDPGILQTFNTPQEFEDLKSKNK